MATGPCLSRRDLLFGRAAAAVEPPALRPPWAKAEPAFTAACTRCDACLQQCPAQVLVRDDEGLPRFDPRAGECTFCGRCAEACERGAFDRQRDPPWHLVARVTGDCLAARGVVCASCRDACPASAIRVPPGARGAATVDASHCTGCGACVAACPVDALILQHAAEMKA